MQTYVIKVTDSGRAQVRALSESGALLGKTQEMSLVDAINWLSMVTTGSIYSDDERTDPLIELKGAG